VHMPRLGRPKKPLVLTDDERETLERWARRPKSPQSLALRSKIVLACAEGPTNREVAARLGVAEATVGKWQTWLGHSPTRRPVLRLEWWTVSGLRQSSLPVGWGGSGAGYDGGSTRFSGQRAAVPLGPVPMRLRISRHIHAARTPPPPHTAITTACVGPCRATIATMTPTTATESARAANQAKDR